MKGLLIPILKKTNIDSTVPNSYRPITVSVMFSKLLEYHILDRCSSHQFSAHQFGFVADRWCDIATAPIHDVCAYANASGSTLFLCSLDAEGAFDLLPHVVILQKAFGIISDEFWRLLNVWYSNMTIKIRWNMKLSNEIRVERGTRKGGLTSPCLFNLFYQPLIESLNLCNTGITVGGCNMNAICYADDIMLCSLTSSGLQDLIEKANSYIKGHGLKFNPLKTECMVSGTNPFSVLPSWILENSILQVAPSIKYLGTVLCPKGDCHLASRKVAAEKAYYSLQGAGLKFNGLNPKTSFSIYRTAVQSITSFGCSSIYLSQTKLKNWMFFRINT